MLDERGAAAAEFAVAVPAVLVVLALGIGVLSAGATAVRLQHATADAARLLGRGDDASRAIDVVARAGAAAQIARTDGMVCVSAAVAVPFGLPDLTARSCALDGGR
ncbi:hypothetical protein ACFWZW_03055 [Microbacterium enclense]|uniref:hypothetical protein n=1 Tax=Microbacterium enclense TaxID=993073 RepID=UPI0036DC7824